MTNAALEILMKQLKIMLKTVEKSVTARLRANQIVDSILEDLESEKPSVSTFNAYLAAHTKNYELEVENEKLNRECKRLQEELDMLKAEKESLEEKHENECRQISAYDEELKETKRMATIYGFARMCRANNDCEFCPMTKAKLAVDYECSTCAEMMADHPDEANAAILKWCAEHPEQPESVSEQPVKEDQETKVDLEKPIDSDFFLKPCPFCGNKSFFDWGKCTGTMAGFDYVSCDDCGATVEALRNPNLSLRDCENAAFMLWNTRFGEPESVSEQPEEPEKPKKTYKQDFLEKFPNAERRMDGSPSVCRNKVYNCGGCFLNKSCTSCWNEAMENTDE